MSYKVELPPDLNDSLGGLSLPKKTGDSGDSGDITEGQILAVEIRSEVLGADIWFALTDDWRPDAGDRRAVFYASELVFLKTKTPAELRAIHKVKVTFGPGSKVRQ